MCNPYKLIQLTLWMCLLPAITFAQEEPTIPATITTASAPIYHTDSNPYPSLYGSFGDSVQIQSTNQPRYRVLYRDKTYWINQEDLAFMDHFSDFSSSNLLSPRLIQDEDNYYALFYNDDKLQRFNLITGDRRVLMSIDGLSEIYPSTQGTKVVLEGITTNGGTIHHFEVFDALQGETVWLASFRASVATLVSAEFSPDQKYVLLSFQVKDKFHSLLYSVADHKLLARGIHISQTAWYYDNIIFMDKEKAWSIPLAGIEKTGSVAPSRQSLLFYIEDSWYQPEEDSLGFSIVGDTMYIEAGNQVKAFVFLTRTLSNTDYRSSVIHPSGRFVFFTEGEQQYVFDTSDRVYIRPFYGSLPEKATFIRFLDNYMLYRYAQKSIASYTLQNLYTKETYIYPLIDEVHASSNDGGLLEMVSEKGQVWLLFDHPLHQISQIIPVSGDFVED